ncbi:MAG TPA: hypothetical protein VLL97_11200 [Acidobacteriota bacterium]|nr:hypothetical protein [Acidobacteriota bacterium]
MKNNSIKKYMRWVVALAVLALVPAAVATAQTPEERIDAAFAQALEKGIPVSLLENKQAEGKAKGIPMDRIAEAVETRLRNLERAREAMRNATDVDAAQLSVGADAIGSGVSEAAIAQIAETTKQDRRSVALAVLTHLVEVEGLASETALARVQTALKEGSQALVNMMRRSGAAVGRTPGVVPPAGKPGTVGPPASVPAPGRGGPPVDPPGGGIPENIDIPEPTAGGAAKGRP